MLSNAYFLAKFRFDTAENEPAKNLQNLNFRKMHFSKCIFRKMQPRTSPGEWRSDGASPEATKAEAQLAHSMRGHRRGVANFWQIFGKIRSFSAVSAPFFASKWPKNGLHHPMMSSSHHPIMTTSHHPIISYHRISGRHICFENGLLTQPVKRFFGGAKQ